MADDDVIDEEFEVEIEADLDVDVDDLDEDDLTDDVVVDEVLVVDDDALVVEPDEDEAIDTEPAPRGRKKPAGDEESEDEEEVVDPDDVEADLDAILKVRIAAPDDEDDDDEVEVVDTRAPETPDGVTPKKANEFTCPGCFLLVNRGQFGPLDNMSCPVGESDCPAITIIQKAKR